jgi:hypothetical protein
MTGVLLVHRDEPQICAGTPFFLSEKGDCLETQRGQCLVDYEDARGSGTLYKSAKMLRLKKDLTKEAAAKSSPREAPKSKELIRP